VDGSLRWTEQQSALERGWFLSELEQHFGYGLEELARRFDRSVSWVSRRLALVELLPEALQQQVRTGRIAAQVAMKYLVPAARLSWEGCERLAAIFAQHHCDTRDAGQLYAAWRDGTPVVRERILAAPELFLKTLRRTTAGGEPQVERDLEMATAILRRTGRHLRAALPNKRNEPRFWNCTPRGRASTRLHACWESPVRACARCCARMPSRFRRSIAPRKPNLTDSASWISSATARGISCESMKHCWQAARNCRSRR
jgi:hypothetical protein